MLIRSQDKKDLINHDNIKRLSAEKIYGKDGTGWLIEVERQLSIGTYSSEAKVIKVLDMIQKAYTPSAEEVQLYIEGILPEVVLTNRVFQMPQDEEV